MNFELLSLRNGATITINTVEKGKAHTHTGKKSRDSVRDQILSVKRATHTHTHTRQYNL